MENEGKTYRVEVSCSNCGWEGSKEIPWGTPVAVLKAEVCRNCGCSAVTLSMNKYAPRKPMMEDGKFYCGQ